jgi:hypothetical protein
LPFPEPLKVIKHFQRLRATHTVVRLQLSILR